VIRPDAIGDQQAVRLVELFRRFPVQDLTSGMMMRLVLYALLLAAAQPEDTN